MIDILITHRKTVKVDSRAETNERALEVKEAFSPILNVLRSGLRNNILRVFEDYVSGDYCDEEIDEEKTRLLSKPYIRMIYNNMCMAFETD